MRALTLAVILFSASPAFAQDAPLNPIAEEWVMQELAKNQGKTVPIKTSGGLGQALYLSGLVKEGTTTVEVSDKLIEDVVRTRRLFSAPQYKVGENIFVEDGRNLSYRAEIKKINPDGTYEVEVWDKLKSLKFPDLDAGAWRARINEYTGELANPGKTLVEVDGKQVEMERPWLERPNTRTITLTHEQVAKHNNPANTRFGARYELFGYVIDPYTMENGKAYDPILQERLNKANQYVDRMFQSGELDLKLPGDPKAREAKLEQIAKAQREVIREIWSQNRMSYLRGDAASRAFNEARQIPELRDGHKIKVGAQLKSCVGVCSDQTAGLTSVLREVGRRTGFDVKPLGGSTITGGGHAFMVVRLANGNRHIMDPSWHSVSANTKSIALESIPFAMYDGRWWSNRVITTFSEGARPAEFIAPGSPAETAARRGYTDKEASLFKNGLDKVQNSKVGKTVKNEVKGAGTFAAAYLVKEGIKALETGDLGQMKDAAAEMGKGTFWRDVAGFSVAARLTEKGLNKLPLKGLSKGLSKAALPLAAGMAAVQLMNGEASVKDLAISTGSFLVAGAAVNLLADGLIYPALFAAGPPGWIAAGVYTVAKLAVTLYLGEKLEGWIHGLFENDKPDASAPRTRQGVKQKIDGMLEDK